MYRLMFHQPQEKGAIALIVAILFGFGVMVGAAALTIDVGNINADRRQLQNGADAVALAVAEQCAATGECDPNDPTLVTLANVNAADGFTKLGRVDSPDSGTPAICGSGTGLDPCPSTWTLSTGNLQECPPATIPAGARGNVRVYTQTLDASGKTLLPYSFGAAIAGVGSGANQQTCAAVAWGRPGPTTSAVPIALSFCEWKAATGYGSTNPDNFAPKPVPPDPGYTHTVSSPQTQPLWPQPAQDPPVPGQEIVVNLQGSADQVCANWQGADAPGGFAWLSQSGACTATAANNGWIEVSTGSGDQCKIPGGGTDLSKYFQKVTYLPVYDCVYGSGAMPTFEPTSATDCAPEPGSGPGGGNVWYHLEGYAAFYLSGWYFNGGDLQASPTNGLVPTCAKSTCISGWFTQGLVDEPVAIDDGSGGGPGLGAWTLQELG